ncbi:MAG TPA: hypothetical protein VFU36_03800 [Jatrophihabitans sp.]|nr:hypothetical protein [Jatrophihabitans sp.]
MPADRGHAVAVRVTANRSPYLSTWTGSWPVRPRWWHCLSGTKA